MSIGHYTLSAVALVYDRHVAELLSKVKKMVNLVSIAILLIMCDIDVLSLTKVQDNRCY